MKALTMSLSLAIVGCIFAAIATAAVPNYINYQGSLTDSSGNPITATINIRFDLYADSSGGSSLWNESHSLVDVTDGLFRITLGSVSAIPDSLFDGSIRWLEIRVGSETLSPREKIVAVPYSLKSEISDHAILTDSAWYATYSDTANWALGAPATTRVDTADYSFQAGHSLISDSAQYSIYSDTSSWALGFEEITHVDTADFAFEAQHAIRSDSATYAATSNYATSAGHATNADSALYAPDTDWAISGGNVYRLTGNVGVGTSTPADKLDVNGTVKMTGFQLPTGALNGRVLMSDSTGIGSWQPAPGFSGSGTTSYIPKFTGSLTLGNSIIYQNGGYVGINMTNPSAELSLYGPAGQLRIYNPATGTDYNGFALGYISENSLNIGIWNRETGFIEFGTDDTERMRITEGGNVGINTSSPVSKLGVAGNIAVGESYAGLNIAPDNGMIVQGNIGIGTTTPRSKLSVAGKMAVGLTYAGNYTAPDNGVLIEGNTGIGTYTPTEKLDVNGTVKMTGFKLPTGASNGYILTSDGSGTGTWQPESGNIDGSGTQNYLAKFDDANTISSSAICQSGDSIGIGTPFPSEKLQVNGNIKVNGFIMPTGASNGLVLTSNASGAGSWQASMTSTGTPYYIPQFITSNSLANSVIYQSSNYIGIGNTSPSHKLTIQNTAADDVLRLIGPDGGFGYGARLNFGDGDLVYLDEDVDDALTIYGNGRTAIMGGNVGIGTLSPTTNLEVNGSILASTINTGLGYTELYLMNQNVRTTDAVTFATVNTGLGNFELYAMDQNVRTTDAVTFSTINTGIGVTEVYLMNQNVRSTDAVTFTTVNTGQGNYELYAMNQNVQTTDNPTFNRVYLNDYGYALGGFHVGGTSDPGDDNLIVDGNTSLGTTYTTHRLVVANTAADDVLRLIGPDGTSIGYGARLNFGDADYVYLDEDTDDHLYVYAANGTALMGGYVGVATTNPVYPLDVAGNCHASSFPTSSDARLKTNVQQLTGVLDKVDKIRGVSFDWNSTYEAMGRSTGHREIGVIAQEVEAQFPELVTTWGDEHYRAVDYGRLAAVLIEAVKELKAENQALQKRVEVLEKLK
jgi:hypothetical protein